MARPLSLELRFARRFPAPVAMPEDPAPQPASAYRFDRYELRPGERLFLADGAPVKLGAPAFTCCRPLSGMRRNRHAGVHPPHREGSGNLDRAPLPGSR